MSPMNTKLLIPALLVAGLLALAPAAGAIYVVTPLTLHPSESEVQVGDSVEFRVEPQNESEAAAWAGRTVSVIYTWNAAEGNESAQSPDEPTDSSSMQERVLLEALTLDDAARASFQWTVPDEVDDHNVDVMLVDEDGERVAFTYLAVGDAPPNMRILAGSGPAPAPEPANGTPEDGAAGGDAPAGADESAEPRQDTPGAGLVAIVGVVGALALALARRR